MALFLQNLYRSEFGKFISKTRFEPTHGEVDGYKGMPTVLPREPNVPLVKSPLGRMIETALSRLWEDIGLNSTQEIGNGAFIAGGCIERAFDMFSEVKPGCGNRTEIISSDIDIFYFQPAEMSLDERIIADERRVGDERFGDAPAVGESSVEQIRGKVRLDIIDFIQKSTSVVMTKIGLTMDAQHMIFSDVLSIVFKSLQFIPLGLLEGRASTDERGVASSPMTQRIDNFVSRFDIDCCAMWYNRTTGLHIHPRAEEALRTRVNILRPDGINSGSRILKYIGRGYDVRFTNFSDSGFFGYLNEIWQVFIKTFLSTKDINVAIETVGYGYFRGVLRRILYDFDFDLLYASVKKTDEGWSLQPFMFSTALQVYHDKQQTASTSAEAREMKEKFAMEMNWCFGSCSFKDVFEAGILEMTNEQQDTASVMDLHRLHCIENSLRKLHLSAEEIQRFSTVTRGRRYYSMTDTMGEHIYRPFWRTATEAAATKLLEDCGETGFLENVELVMHKTGSQSIGYYREKGFVGMGYDEPVKCGYKNFVFTILRAVATGKSLSYHAPLKFASNDLNLQAINEFLDGVNGPGRLQLIKDHITSYMLKWYGSHDQYNAFYELSKKVIENLIEDNVFGHGPDSFREKRWTSLLDMLREKILFDRTPIPNWFA